LRLLLLLLLLLLRRRRRRRPAMVLPVADKAEDNDSKRTRRSKRKLPEM
jgi:hypothetical protein